MPIQRTHASYDDACATAHAVDLIGDHWSLIVVRELILGPKRFQDLQRSIIGISPAVLTARLRHLESVGVVRRTQSPPPAPAKLYELTQWGAGLERVIYALAHWAHGSDQPRGTKLTPDNLILSLRTMGSAIPAPSPGVRLVLRLYDERLDPSPSNYSVTWTDGPLLGVRGPIPDPQATVTGDSSLLAGIIHMGVPLEPALTSGAVQIEGDAAAFSRLITAIREGARQA